MKCLLLEGPLYTICVPYVIKQITDIPTIISTWEDEDPATIEELKQYTPHVLLNKKPTLQKRVNFPNTTIQNGLLFAKQIGFTHALVFRFDNYCPQMGQLLEICASESETKLVGISWFHHVGPYHPHGYILDYMMYGPIDVLYRYRSSSQQDEDPRPPEAFLQEAYFKKSPVTYEDVKSDVCFILDKLIENKIEFYWTHHHTEWGNTTDAWGRDHRMNRI